ncbi:hypothetical protein VTI74DRAFT_1025 [Chaetomium olivicolor]
MCLRKMWDLTESRPLACGYGRESLDQGIRNRHVSQPSTDHTGGLGETGTSHRCCKSLCVPPAADPYSCFAILPGHRNPSSPFPPYPSRTDKLGASLWPFCPPCRSTIPLQLSAPHRGCLVYLSQQRIWARVLDGAGWLAGAEIDTLPTVQAPKYHAILVRYCFLSFSKQRRPSITLVDVRCLTHIHTHHTTCRKKFCATLPCFHRCYCGVRVCQSCLAPAAAAVGAAAR